MADAIDKLIEREGGYVNHPADKGGPTKYGITLRTLADWRSPRPVTAADVETLSPVEARAIYIARYQDAPGFSRIANAEVRDFVVDTGVLHGPGRAAKWLQEAAGVEADGKLGPKTLGAVAAASPRLLIKRIAVSRLLHFAGIVKADPSQEAFLRGWFNRVMEQL